MYCCENPQLIQESYYDVCETCGQTQEANRYVLTYSELGSYSKIYKTTYVPNYHFSHSLKKIFGFIGTPLNKKHLLLLTPCKTRNDIVNTLKKYKLNTLYIYTTYICNVVIHEPLPIISHYELHTLNTKYEKFHNKFLDNNDNRKHCLKISFILQQFINEIERPDLEYYIPNLVTSRYKIRLLTKLYNNYI